MKLEDFVKSLKVGKHLVLETADEICRVLEIWRNAEGGYHFSFNFLEHYGESETADEILNYISENCGGKWLECDYEIYKTRAELKAEISALKEKLEKVSKEYEAVWRALTE